MLCLNLQRGEAASTQNCCGLGCGVRQTPLIAIASMQRGRCAEQQLRCGSAPRMAMTSSQKTSAPLGRGRVVHRFDLLQRTVKRGEVDDLVSCQRFGISKGVTQDKNEMFRLGLLHLMSESIKVNHGVMSRKCQTQTTPTARH